MWSADPVSLPIWNERAMAGWHTASNKKRLLRLLLRRGFFIAGRTEVGNGAFSRRNALVAFEPEQRGGIIACNTAEKERTKSR